MVLRIGLTHLEPFWVSIAPRGLDRLARATWM